jgi:DNA-directed RNA polymerase subunit H (RpoH/RPB5)
MKKVRQLKSSEVKKLRSYLIKKQKGLCLICKKKIKRPCLDHHHKKRVKGTGRIRGVLCSNCNIFLAKSENNSVRYAIERDKLPFILRQMAKYLERKQLPFIHPSEKPKAQIVTKQSFNALIKAMRHSGYSKKYPEYRTVTKKNNVTKNAQKLTKPLEKLFDEFGIEPKFYK